LLRILLQIEHHLLPGVNHCHLMALQPAIEAAANRHGVPYHSSPTLLHALRLVVEHLDVSQAGVIPMHSRIFKVASCSCFLLQVLGVKPANEAALGLATSDVLPLA
jgi:hypothetical protein